MAVVLRKAMRLLTWALGFLALAGCLASAKVPATEMQPEIEIFISQMVDRHGFAQAELERILRHGTVSAGNYQCNFTAGYVEAVV